eukprot:m.12477 g.12477  ORF g.12477 m.12477 type:complete len:422 (+) comp2949_c0_seq2:268-1533(+)
MLSQSNAMVLDDGLATAPTGLALRNRQQRQNNQPQDPRQQRQPTQPTQQAGNPNNARQPFRSLQNATTLRATPLGQGAGENHIALTPGTGAMHHTGGANTARPRPSPLRSSGRRSENQPPIPHVHVSMSEDQNDSPPLGRGSVWQEWHQGHSHLRRSASADRVLSVPATTPAWQGSALCNPSKSAHSGDSLKPEVTSKELRKLSWIQPSPTQPTARRLFSSPHTSAGAATPRAGSFHGQGRLRLAFSSGSSSGSAGALSLGSAATSRDNSAELTTQLTQNRHQQQQQQQHQHQHQHQEQAPVLASSGPVAAMASDTSDVDFSLEHHSPQSGPASSSHARRQRRILVQVDSPDRAPRSPPMFTSSPRGGGTSSSFLQRRMLSHHDTSHASPDSSANGSPPMLRRNQLLERLTSSDDCMETDF